MKSCENCTSYKPLNNRKGICTHVNNGKSAITKEVKRHNICTSYVVKP
jgi:hypothetical protein